MKTALIIAFLLACFGIVGRIDYEVALATESSRVEHQTRVAAQDHRVADR